MARHNKKPLKTYPIEYKPGIGDKPNQDIDWRDLRDKDVEARLKFKPANTEQITLCNSLENKQLTLSIGVAGTGKTLCSCAIAAKLLIEDKIDKIVITRPTVGVGGKKLAFLPGSLEEKMLPFVSQMLEYLEDELGKHYFKEYMANGKIEIKAIEYMRGYSGKRVFIICDEAENLNWTELLLLVTRIGKDTKMVLLGDLTQADLEVTGKNLPFYKFIKTMGPLIKSGKIGYSNLTEILRSGILKEIIELLTKANKAAER